MSRGGVALLGLRAGAVLVSSLRRQREPWAAYFTVVHETRIVAALQARVHRDIVTALLADHSLALALSADQHFKRMKAHPFMNRNFRLDLRLRAAPFANVAVAHWDRVLTPHRTLRECSRVRRRRVDHHVFLGWIESVFDGGEVGGEIKRCSLEARLRGLTSWSHLAETVRVASAVVRIDAPAGFDHRPRLPRRLAPLWKRRQKTSVRSARWVTRVRARRIWERRLRAGVDAARRERGVSLPCSPWRAPWIPLRPVTDVRRVVDVVRAESVLRRGVTASEGRRGRDAAPSRREVGCNGVERLAAVGACSAALEAADLVEQAGFANATSSTVEARSARVLIAAAGGTFAAALKRERGATGRTAVGAGEDEAWH